MNFIVETCSDLLSLFDDPNVFKWAKEKAIPSNFIKVLLNVKEEAEQVWSRLPNRHTCENLHS